MTATNDWDGAAAAWDLRRDFVETLKEQLSEALQAGLAISAGDRVLELGAGTGAFAARLADAGGQVLATDLAPAMVDLIRATAQTHPNLTAAVVDAQDTGCATASYDAVVSRMALMLLTDPLAALVDWHRVLRPNGRLAVAVWDAPEHNTWLVALGMSMAIHGAISGPLPTEPGGPFSLASDKALREITEGAGFHATEIRTITMREEFASIDEHFETVAAMAAPLHAALQSATRDTLAAIKATTAEIIEPYKTAAGFSIPAQALVCTAVA
jgi:SAM-dependent methyltransferase